MSMEWEELDEFLIKEFSFKDFKEAISFVDKVGAIAEKANHHPNILMHSYSKVQIMLKTHETNDITEKDFKLAEEIDKIN